MFLVSPGDSLAARERSHFLRSSAGAGGRLAVLHWGLAHLHGGALVLNIVVTPWLALGRTHGGPEQGQVRREVDCFARVCAEPEQAVVVQHLGRGGRQRS